MSEKGKVITRVVLITAAPTLLNCLAKPDSLLDYLQSCGIIGNMVNLSIWKDVMLVSAILLSAVFLSLKLALVEIEQKNVVKQVKSILKYNKEIFIGALESKMLIAGASINVRIFVPRKDILLILEPFLHKLLGHKPGFKREFVIKNIEGMAEVGLTNNLAFEVYPMQQGLVGSCYKARTIVYDDCFKNNMYRYGLTEYQSNKMRDMEFCMCAPIFDKEGNIIKIICFDSTQKINIPKGSKSLWIDMVTNYCQFLSDYLSGLFKHGR